MKRSKKLVSGSMALILAASLLAAMPIQAQKPTLVDSTSAAFNRRCAGVYLVTGVPAAGPPFLLIFNVYQEGMFSASAQVQGTTFSGSAFVDDQGIWKKSGPDQITARLLSFNYMPPGAEPPAGGLHSNAIADVVMDLSKDGSTVSGTFSITVFPLDVNPLAANAKPLGPPNVIKFKGERLTIP